MREGIFYLTFIVIYFLTAWLHSKEKDRLENTVRLYRGFIIKDRRGEAWYRYKSKQEVVDGKDVVDERVYYGVKTRT